MTLKKRQRRAIIYESLGKDKFKEYHDAFHQYGVSDEEVFWLAKNNVFISAAEDENKTNDLLTIIRGAFLHKFGLYSSLDPVRSSLKDSHFYLMHIDSGKFGSVWKSNISYRIPRTARTIDIQKAFKVTAVSAENSNLVELLKGIETPNLIKPEYVVEGEKNLISFNVVGGINLSDYVNEFGAFTPNKSIILGYDILQGLIQLKSVGLSHRDLHARNVLISDNYKPNSSDALLVARIIDLGVVSSDDETRETRTVMANNDLVSLGMLIYKMATGNNMFNDTEEYTIWSEVKNYVHEKKTSSFTNEGVLEQTKQRLYDTLPDIVAPLVVTLTDNNPYAQPDISTLLATDEIFRTEYDRQVSFTELRRHSQIAPKLQQHADFKAPTSFGEQELHDYTNHAVRFKGDGFTLGGL